MTLPRVEMKRRHNGTWHIEIDGQQIPNVASMAYSPRNENSGFPVVTFRVIADLYIEDEPAAASDNIAPWATEAEQ